VIRSPAEAARLTWKIIEFAAQLFTFWLTNVTTDGLALLFDVDLGIVGDLLGLAIAAIVGAVLPSLIFARPRIRVEWEVDGEPASGVAQVDLRGRPRREFTFRAESYVHYESLLGWTVTSAVVRKARDTEIAFNPTGSATRLKKQSQAGNARLHDGTILLPTTNAARGSQQAMGA